MSNEKAITATVVTIASAFLGVIVAAGLPLSRNLTDHILVLITVVTPAVVGLVGWLHHSGAKVIAAREMWGSQGETSKPDSVQKP